MLKHTIAGTTRFTRKYRGPIAAAAAAAVLLGIAVTPMSAQAVGMASAPGNLICQQVPAVFIGASATAKGDVKFQLNNLNNDGQWATRTMGYTTAYSSWNYRFGTGRGGNFYAYGYGATGNATEAKKWCRSF